jgi:hypothetical protein
MHRLWVTLCSGLALAFVCIPLVASGSGGTGATAADADGALGEVIRAIEQRKTDEALKKVDALLLRYPNFRLAHLIRGDLLLARTRPLSTFGNSPDAPAEKLADLREEAVARLKAYRNRPPSNYVPRYLLQMEPDQKFAIVVDTQRSRLYIYQNDSGRPRFVADYYIAQGKLGAEKTARGRQTHAGRRLSRHRQPAAPEAFRLLRQRCLPDQLPQRVGSTAGAQRSRHLAARHPERHLLAPPRASDGCVVLTNQDLDALCPATCKSA